MSSIEERIKKIKEMNEIKQVEFMSMVEESQGMLSELEQDRYKPTTDTLKQMQNMSDTDLMWLLYSEEHSSTKDAIDKRFNDNELALLVQFRKLKANDQDEILEFIKLKINRYGRD